MNEYWISWTSIYERDGGFELHSPWWVSGRAYTFDEQEETIFVAAIRATSEDEAWEKIANAYTTPPHGGVTQRFISPLARDGIVPWDRESARFRLQEWMEW